jgi:ADP-ribose pyrophosphatase YjhB (NUDIX family)
MTGQPRPGQLGWIEPEQWYAQLATQYAAAGALFTDPDGKVLLVKPNYREYWTLPGGMVDHGETPEHALRRELKEELGLDLAVGRLLVIDWASAYARRPRPIVYFLFDAGVLDPGTDIRLQEAELDEYAYVAPGQVAARVASYTAARVPAALSARATGTTLYLPQQARPGT